MRFVQRVEQAFQSINSGGGTVRLKLSPPELGSMRLEITVRNGAMTARVETETTAAKNLLLDNLPALRERLAQQDMKIQSFDVDVADTGKGGTPGQAFSSSDWSSGQAGNRAARASVAEAAAAPTTGASGAAGEGSQLNIVV